LKSVDEIVVFEHGRVIEHGDRTDLVGDDDSRFAQLLAIALDGEQRPLSTTGPGPAVDQEVTS
jgi:ABC-type transport system involved in cytochrome bd biosynthesis fused ATPase/permease subunit